MLIKANFKEENIHSLENPNAAKCKEGFLKIIDTCWKNYMKRQKTMVFVYYAGHSVVDTEMFTLLTSNSNFLFPI